ncbi:hypothetical protein B0O99DRAFT_206300 [Bisporella sp. PMI_857]|nr:hypothetical protein B0O99DRAFT_206300 [Bisporella sp. PMI_857]
MRLPKFSNTTLVVRELGVLPANFCPVCSTCRTDVIQFNKTSSCTSNSSFFASCSGCQQCIVTYKDANGDGLAEAGLYQAALAQVLNLCSNSTTAEQIANFKAQASRLSIIAESRPTSTESLALATSTPASAPVSTTEASSPTLTNSPQQAHQVESFNKIWIAGPVIGSVIALAIIILLIVYTTRTRRNVADKSGLENKEDASSDGDDSTTRDEMDLHSEAAEPQELENIEVYELPAAEPVGNELHTPREGKGEKEDNWPLPVSPLRAMFAMSVLRDEKRGDEGPKHHTYYNP